MSRRTVKIIAIIIAVAIVLDASQRAHDAEGVARDALHEAEQLKSRVSDLEARLNR